jgi:hypothetical protein
MSIVLLHVNTAQLTKVREMVILLVNNVECGSVVNCTLSGICNDVTHKESDLMNFYFLIT